MVELTEDFELDDFCSLYSDAHSQLCLTLHATKPQQILTHLAIASSDSDRIHEKACKWEAEKSQSFCDNIDVHSIILLDTSLTILLSDITVVDKNILNETVNTINSVLLKQPNVYLVYKRNIKIVINVNKVVFKKQWFTAECKNARRNYWKSKRLYKKYGGCVFNDEFKEKEKAYKNILKDVGSSRSANYTVVARSRSHRESRV